MTRRERIERRLELRKMWADRRRERAAAGFAQGERYRGDVAFNTQPGHIPERARVIRAIDRAVEESNMADHHEAKAAGIERQLDTTIFSDDADAAEAIRKKVAAGRVQIERMKTANKIVRKFKGDIPAGVAALVAAGFPSSFARLFEPDFAGRLGFPSYELTNLGANIRRLEGRIVEIERRKARTEQAETAPGGVVVSGGADFVNVTFAEKPDRTVLDDLRAAGFRWGGGCWSGYRGKLPDSVKALEEMAEQKAEAI